MNVMIGALRCFLSAHFEHSCLSMFCTWNEVSDKISCDFGHIQRPTNGSKWDFPLGLTQRAVGIEGTHF